MVAGADDHLRSELLLDEADQEAEEANLYFEPLNDVSGGTRHLIMPGAHT